MMSLLIENTLRSRARRQTSTKSATTILTERSRKQVTFAKTDIFLSHAFDDKELLLGAVLTIEELGFSVYIDWRDDTEMDRKHVTAATAAKLRERMQGSKCLLYAVTPSATDSIWMKWELGYKDGENGRTAILPIVGNSTEAYSASQEFVALYPYVSDGMAGGKNHLWIHRSPKVYVGFTSWLNGEEPYHHD